MTATAVAPVILPPAVPLVPLASAQPVGPLPEPVLEPASPQDVMGMVMTLMNQMSMSSMAETEHRIQVNHERLAQAVAELSQRLHEAIEEAKKSSGHHHGGMFGWVSDAIDEVTAVVSKVIGKVAGLVADLTVDVVMAPFDIIAGIIKGDGLGKLLQQELYDLSHDGAVSAHVQGFARGAARFIGDLEKFAHSYAAMIEAGLRGENMLDEMKAQAKQLWGSFVDNVVKNPDVWEVTSFVLKASAAVVAIGSGGTLALFGVALVALSELDKRYHIADAVFGKQAGPWVSMGLEISASLLMGLGVGMTTGDVSTTAKWVEGIAGSVAGVMSVAKGINDAIERYQQAHELDGQAELLELSNRMQRLQRVLDALIDELQRKSEQHQRIFKAGQQLYQIQGQTHEAAVFRA